MTEDSNKFNISNDTLYILKQENNELKHKLACNHALLIETQNNYQSAKAKVQDLLTIINVNKTVIDNTMRKVHEADLVWSKRLEASHQKLIEFGTKLLHNLRSTRLKRLIFQCWRSVVYKQLDIKPYLKKIESMKRRLKLQNYFSLWANHTNRLVLHKTRLALAIKISREGHQNTILHRYLLFYTKQRDKLVIRNSLREWKAAVNIQMLRQKAALQWYFSKWLSFNKNQKFKELILQTCIAKRKDKFRKRTVMARLKRIVWQKKLQTSNDLIQYEYLMEAANRANLEQRMDNLQTMILSLRHRWMITGYSLLQRHRCQKNKALCFLYICMHAKQKKYKTRSRKIILSMENKQWLYRVWSTWKYYILVIRSQRRNRLVIAFHAFDKYKHYHKLIVKSLSLLVQDKKKRIIRRYWVTWAKILNKFHCDRTMLAIDIHYQEEVQRIQQQQNHNLYVERTRRRCHAIQISRLCQKYLCQSSLRNYFQVWFRLCRKEVRRRHILRRILLRHYIKLLMLSFSRWAREARKRSLISVVTWGLKTYRKLRMQLRGWYCWKSRSYARRIKRLQECIAMSAEDRLTTKQLAATAKFQINKSNSFLLWRLKALQHSSANKLMAMAHRNKLQVLFQWWRMYTHLHNRYISAIVMYTKVKCNRFENSKAISKSMLLWKMEYFRLKTLKKLKLVRLWYHLRTVAHHQNIKSISSSLRKWKEIITHDTAMERMTNYSLLMDSIILCGNMFTQWKLHVIKCKAKRHLIECLLLRAMQFAAKQQTRSAFTQWCFNCKNAIAKEEIKQVIHKKYITLILRNCQKYRVREYLQHVIYQWRIKMLQQKEELRKWSRVIYILKNTYMYNHWCVWKTNARLCSRQQRLVLVLRSCRTRNAWNHWKYIWWLYTSYKKLKRLTRAWHIAMQRRGYTCWKHYLQHIKIQQIQRMEKCFALWKAVILRLNELQQISTKRHMNLQLNHSFLAWKKVISLHSVQKIALHRLLQRLYTRQMHTMWCVWRIKCVIFAGENKLKLQREALCVILKWWRMMEKRKKDIIQQLLRDKEMLQSNSAVRKVLFMTIFVKFHVQKINASVLRIHMAFKLWKAQKLVRKAQLVSLKMLLSKINDPKYKLLTNWVFWRYKVCSAKYRPLQVVSDVVAIDVKSQCDARTSILLDKHSQTDELWHALNDIPDKMDECDSVITPPNRQWTHDTVLEPPKRQGQAILAHHQHFHDCRRRTLDLRDIVQNLPMQIVNINPSNNSQLASLKQEMLVTSHTKRNNEIRGCKWQATSEVFKQKTIANPNIHPYSNIQGIRQVYSNQNRNSALNKQVFRSHRRGGRIRSLDAKYFHIWKLRYIDVASTKAEHKQRELLKALDQLTAYQSNLRSTCTKS